MGECQSACSYEDDQLRQRQLQKSMTIQYNGQRFIMPEVMSFERQATFVKVEQAARAFCQKNNISLFHTPIVTRIIAYRHEFVFQQIWNRLNQNERDEFMDDLDNTPHDLMDSFYYHFVLKRKLKPSEATLKKSICLPKVTKESRISAEQKQALFSFGRQMLQMNKVGVVFMCAGSSSRFDGEDKFLCPFKIGGQTFTIFDLLFLRLRRNAGGNGDVPIVVNCNQFNAGKIQEYLKDRNYYGFNPSKFRFPTIYSLPVFDQNGKYCINVKMKLIKRSAGTAACAQSLVMSNMGIFLQNEGVRYVYFSGMQNLLENPGDPVFLGMVVSERRKIGAKCVNPIFGAQKLPRYFSGSEGNESVDVLSPQEQEQIQNGEILDHLPVAINSMVFELESLTQTIADYNKCLFLAEKYHVIAKMEKLFNIKFFKEEMQMCYSFQKDLRDIISCVESPVLYKVSRTKEYAPIYSKNERYCLAIALNFFGGRLKEEFQRQNL